MADDPDELLGMLADLTGATDRRLRDLAQRLAGRLFLDVARRGTTVRRGIGRIESLPYRPDGGDLDIDASIEAIAEAGRGAIDGFVALFLLQAAPVLDVARVLVERF